MVGRLPTPEEDRAWNPFDVPNDGAGLQVLVGRADARGRCKVVAKLGNKSHPHTFDPFDQFQRKQFREAVVSKFELSEDAHEHLETSILAAGERGATSLFKPQITRLSDVTPQAVEALWDGHLYIGKVTLLCGNPGLGKSFASLALGAIASNGRGYPDAPHKRHKPRGVVILSAEDDVSDTIVPRLIAHGADLSRIVTLDGLKDTDDDGSEMVHAIDLSCHLDYVRAAIDQVEDPGLLIVDPISAFLGKVDSHKNAEVRCVLAALSALANEKRIAVLAITHLRKSGEGEAIHKAMGSLAFVAAARAAFAVCRDPKNPISRRRLFLPMKNNLASDLDGLAYSLEPLGPDGATVVVWEAEPVSTSVDDALSGERNKPGPKPEQREKAEEWLRQQLAKGQQPCQGVFNLAKREGFNERLLQRAFKAIDGVRSREGLSGPWLWSLPVDDNCDGTERTCRPVVYDEYTDGVGYIDDTFPNRRQDDQLSVSDDAVAYAEFEAERAAIMAEHLEPEDEQQW